MGRRRPFTLLAAAAGAAVLALSACGAPGSTADPASGAPGDVSAPGSPAPAPSAPGSADPSPATGDPINVGVVTSLSGPLQSYGEQYVAGLKVGLDHATGGTGAVGGREVHLEIVDDAGDPAKATAAATDLVGQGYRVLAGSASSGVALQMAPLAADNQVLFVSGAAASDAITGANRYTFRSGRQSYQDTMTAASYLGDVKGKKVTVFAQDNTFGKGNVAAVQAVFGGQGATVGSVLVPETATDLTPYGKQAAESGSDLLFVAWAGTNATQMWTALDQQGAFDAATVVTGLDITATWPAFGAVADKVSFLSHFFDGASDNAAEKALTDGLKEAGEVPDLFSPDGFAAGQMIVHALQASPDDVEAMITALEGFSFEGPKGEMTIRAEDHALLQPMFQAKLSGSGTDLRAELVTTLPAADTAPPVTPFP